MIASREIEQSNYLSVLAARIKENHTTAQDALKRGFQHAVAAGELLLEARQKVKHGQWGPFLAVCGIPARTAHLYMDVAKNKAKIEAHADDVAELSLRQAARFVGEERARTRGAGAWPDLEKFIPPVSILHADGLWQAREETWRKLVANEEGASDDAEEVIQPLLDAWRATPAGSQIWFLARIHSVGMLPAEGQLVQRSEELGVLNARTGWWQARKKAWLALGIRSELGRDENLAFNQRGLSDIQRQRRRPKLG